MSIFSHIRRSRQQAKDHNAKVAKQQEKEDDNIPYRHVPTHAATDAIASAPPSMREADRPKIKEQNRRRSALVAAQGLNVNLSQSHRVGGSSLSHVSFPSGEATPVVPRMPRAYSYNGYSNERQGLYSVPDVALSQPTSLKGKEVDRTLYGGSPHISPSSSKVLEPSLVNSSSTSVSSQETSEKKSAQRPQSSSGKQDNHVIPAERPHRLHPSRRHLSDSSVYRLSNIQSSKSSTSRDSRPPPSTRGFDSIPPVPPIPSIRLVNQHGPNVSTMVPSSRYDASGASTPRGMSSSRSHRISALDIPSYTLTSTESISPSTSSPTTPSAAYHEFSFPSSSDSTAPATPSLDFDFGVAVTSAASTPRSYEECVPKIAPFSELERFESDMEASYFNLPHMKQPRVSTIPISPLLQPVVNIFPEPTPSPAPIKSKSKRLSKGAALGGKKHRTSLSA